MPTPKGGYRDAAGNVIPSVSTVLGSLGWKTGGLIHWAWNLGMDGKDYRQVKDEAASIGTLAHLMVEADIHERTVDRNGYGDELWDPATVAFGAYQEWKENTRVVPVATEVRLVSEKYAVGGTADIIALTKRGLSLPDVKTAAGLYADYLIQIAAYGGLWEEVTGMTLDGGYHLLRFDKTSGGFTQKWIPRAALRPAWSAFLRLRDLHEFRKPLEALAK